MKPIFHSWVLDECAVVSLQSIYQRSFFDCKWLDALCGSMSNYRWQQHRLNGAWSCSLTRVAVALRHENQRGYFHREIKKPNKFIVDSRSRSSSLPFGLGSCNANNISDNHVAINLWTWSLIVVPTRTKRDSLPRKNRHARLLLDRRSPVRKSIWRGKKKFEIFFRYHQFRGP